MWGRIGRTLAIFLVLSQVIIMNPSPGQALSGGDFNPGRIIDDSIFFVPGDLDTSAIQNFLNGKVSACDTNGTTTIYDSVQGDTVTRAVYSQRRGYSAPFTCLRDYRQDVPGQAASSAGLCNAIGGGNKSAAQIIRDVANACSINSKVLLVLLQKEQGLVTDTWPWSIQYRSATGYGCPDTADCDSNYYGFFNQVYMAAWQFKKYAQSPTSFNYRSGRTNTILWNPTVSCGSSSVYIENQATAGLYNYTPYRPNGPALANLYGNGDNCSAYGNRNFWRYYNDWFGSTYSNDLCFLEQNSWGNFSQRMVNKNGYHFFTNNPKEQCIAQKMVGYGIEPLAGYKVDSTQVAGTTPVFKLVNDGTGDHFYTISTSERDIARDIVRYRDMQVAFYVYPTQQPGTVPVYRLVHPATGDHFYTTDANERDIAKNAVRYVDEGVAFWVNP
jgi:hypothetical protein